MDWIGKVFVNGSFSDEEYAACAEWCNATQLAYIDPTDYGFICVAKVVTEEDIREGIRTRRERECFTFINRGTFWYDTLTAEQKEELREWYLDWLDAPQTMVIPEKPSWLV